MESTEMISPLSRSASSKAISDFPTAVGPASKMGRTSAPEVSGFGVTKKQPGTFWLFFLAAGRVARSLQIRLYMRLASALPAAKTPVP